jgi:hypothetical protein
LIAQKKANMKKFLTALAFSTALVTVPGHANYVTPVYRARPVYRPPVVSRPVVRRPTVVGRPVIGHHLPQGQHRHNIHHGMHGHFHNGLWIANPNDPPYVGDDNDNSGDDQGNPNAASSPGGANNGPYGAAAVAMFTNANGDGAATGGVGTAGDPNTAASRAIRLCESQGGGGNCVVVSRFRGGCGYLSIGGLSSDQFVNAGRSYWGFAATPQEAFAQCAQHMVGCGQPFGACTPSR